MSTEYIERGALIGAIEATEFLTMQDAATTLQLVTEAPAADVEPVVHGEWKWKPPYMVCTACNRHAINRYQSKYCQHCGAKMHNPRGAHMDERSEHED